MCPNKGRVPDLDIAVLTWGHTYLKPGVRLCAIAWLAFHGEDLGRTWTTADLARREGINESDLSWLGS